MLLALGLLAGLTACGGGGGSTAASAEEVSATLAIISTNIETAQGSGSFQPATEGQSLVVGDKVKTDTTGFAELTYHDGSWQRIEQSATLTIEELTDQGDTDTVKTSIDIGQSWNRVEELTQPDDAYELETPVGTAAVRGTAFATDCETAAVCTFQVVDGTVEVTPLTGDPVTLTAGQQITITADAPPPAATTPGVPTLSADPFIAKNLELDQTRGVGSASADTSKSSSEGAAGANFEGAWIATTSGPRTVTTIGGGAPEGQASDPTERLTGEWNVQCDSTTCTVLGRDLTFVEEAGRTLVVSSATLKPPSPPCDLPPLEDVQVVTTEGPEVARFTVSWAAYTDECQQVTQYAADLTLSRVT